MTHQIHDFTAKLRQPSLIGHLEKYIAWRRELRRARRDGVPEPDPPPLSPVSINLDLTTACNYRCTHCIDTEILNTKFRFDDDELRRSIEHMSERGLRSVILIGGGEPTLYPRFADFVRFLKERNLQISVVTNGSRNDLLLEIAGLCDERDWFRLSLDSGSNELFREMHLPVRKDMTLDAICEWIPRIKEANPRIPLGYSYVISWEGASLGGKAIPENIHEIEMAAARAKRYGFDYLSLKPVLERTPEGAEVMDPSRAREELAGVIARIREQVDLAKRHADDSFHVYESINLRLLEEDRWREYTRQPRVCHMQALRQVLTPLGLYNCPAHRGVQKAKIASKSAYRDEAALKETAGLLRDLMDRFDAGRECAEVTCLYHSTNWWLEERIEDRGGTASLEPGLEQLDWFL